MAQPFVTGVSPSRAIEGGRVTLVGEFGHVDSLADVRVEGRPARTVFTSSKRLSFIVPSGISEGGAGPASISVNNVPIENAGIEFGVAIATGLHQVDNPLIDRAGNVYLTYSGTRGQQVPVSIFRVAPNGVRETYSSSVVNPTSMAMDSDGRLYVSSRFEGAVYRLADDGSAEPFATDLGIACGLAFAPDGTLFVGDRSGTIFSVDRSGKATIFASLPSSVAAFHLALGPDALYVAAPTLSPYDAIYQIAFDGSVSIYSRAFGRPQGIAFGPDRSLFVVEALAGASGLYRVKPDSATELVVAGSGLIGLAFDSPGAMIVCSSDTAYRFQSLS
jgi:outer membrane protein assembly factor BamB